MERETSLEVDDRLVAAGSGYEICDGVLSPLAVPDALRGLRLSKLLTVIEAHAAPALDVAYRMLTRTSATSDLAVDVSVVPGAPDPRTGGRQLAQLAFEVVSRATLDQAARKAAALTARGVRRMFAIDIEHGRVLEWRTPSAAWLRVGSTAIDDPALVIALPIEALVTIRTDEAIARALQIKRRLIAREADAVYAGVLAEVLRAT